MPFGDFINEVVTKRRLRFLALLEKTCFTIRKLINNKKPLSRRGSGFVIFS